MWLRLAADAGEGIALTWLGQMYKKGSKGLAKDWTCPLN